jgi:glycosyltransferase involved in cell wall biosynthesis
MKVGIVTAWCERGAAYVSRLYHDVLEKEHSCYIYARGGESYDKSAHWNWDNVYFGRIVINGRPMAINRKDFELWIKENGIELIIFNEQQCWLPVIWCKDAGVKSIAYIDYYTEETLPFFSLYDAVICNTRRHCEALDFHQNLIYIPWGTDVKLFQPKTEVRKDKKLVFFHSCGVSPERKGTELLVEAFSSLLNEDIKLIIHSQVALENKVKPEIATILTKDKRIEILQCSVSAPGLYHLGDVYVYPTYLEGIGLTIAEAISCGLPVIVPNAKPMNEFIEDSFAKAIDIEREYSRKDGYYWPKVKVSIEHLSQCMNYYIENIEKLPAIKSKARTYAEHNLDWHVNSSSLCKLLPKIDFVDANNNTLNACLAYENKRKRVPLLFEPLVTFLFKLVRLGKF